MGRLTTMAVTSGKHFKHDTELVFRTLYITWPITTSQDALYSMEYPNTQHRRNVHAVIPPNPTA